MKHEKITIDRTGSISRLLRRTLQANAILFGIFGLLQPAMAQVVQQVVITDVRYKMVQPITNWRSLQNGDTIRLKEGNKLAWYRIECVGKESAKTKSIMKRKIEDGDTLTIVKADVRRH